MKVLLAVSTILVVLSSNHTISAEEDSLDAYMPYVEAIHPYKVFSSPRFKDPEGVFTRTNYDLFLRIFAKHYKKVFSIEEMKKIAEFYDSNLGKRFLVFHTETFPGDAFLEALRRADSIETGTGDWTCPLHDHMRNPDKGKCPICKMDMVLSNPEW